MDVINLVYLLKAEQSDLFKCANAFIRITNNICFVKENFISNKDFATIKKFNSHFF